MRTSEQLDAAILALIEWRAEYGLEKTDGIEFERRLREGKQGQPEIDRDEFSMCSANTQKLAEILYNHKFANLERDERITKYYPLLDRIVEWMDDFYG